MTRPRKNPATSGIRTWDRPLSRRMPWPLGQWGGPQVGLEILVFSEVCGIFWNLFFSGFLRALVSSPPSLVNGFNQWNKAQINVISTLPIFAAELSLLNMWQATCRSWLAPNVLHDCAVTTWACVGNSLHHNVEIVNILNCTFQCDYSVIFFFFCVPQLYLWGSPFWVRFLCMWLFLIQPLR